MNICFWFFFHLNIIKGWGRYVGLAKYQWNAHLDISLFVRLIFIDLNDNNLFSTITNELRLKWKTFNIPILVIINMVLYMFATVLESKPLCVYAIFFSQNYHFVRFERGKAIVDATNDMGLNQHEMKTKKRMKKRKSSNGIASCVSFCCCWIL